MTHQRPHVRHVKVKVRLSTTGIRDTIQDTSHTPTHHHRRQTPTMSRSHIYFSPLTLRVTQ
jgi:hypothetical protein